MRNYLQILSIFVAGYEPNNVRYGERYHSKKFQLPILAWLFIHYIDLPILLCRKNNEKHDF